MSPNQRQIIEQGKFSYYPLQNVFEKQTKTEEQRKKNIDATTNQNKRLAASTNKDDDHKDNDKEIFEELVQ